jgi:hypothetical protein
MLAELALCTAAIGIPALIAYVTHPSTVNRDRRRMPR